MNNTLGRASVGPDTASAGPACSHQTLNANLNQKSIFEAQPEVNFWQDGPNMMEDWMDGELPSPLKWKGELKRMPPVNRVRSCLSICFNRCHLPLRERASSSACRLSTASGLTLTITSQKCEAVPRRARI